MVTSRIRFTAAQKAELWERWKNGQSDTASQGAAVDAVASASIDAAASRVRHVQPCARTA